MPLISVIVPIYNVEAYLEKCINSIICQSYRNLEIILVNDGSTDNSQKICEEYKKKDSRIKVIHKENGGLSDARNCGLEIATGEYIAFLDSDDWIDEELYSTLYNLIKKYNADISICSFKNVFSEDEKLNRINNEYVYDNIEALNRLYTKEGTQMVVAWNKLYKRKILSNMKFPKGKIHEDAFLIPRLLYNAKRIAYIEKELIYYRYTPNSITNSKFNIKRLDYLEALDNTNNFFKEKKLDELYLRGVVSEIESMLTFALYVQGLEKNEKDNIINEFIIKIREKESIINESINKKTKMKINLFKLSPKLYVNMYLYKDRIKKFIRNAG